MGLGGKINNNGSHDINNPSLYEFPQEKLKRIFVNQKIKVLTYNFKISILNY